MADQVYYNVLISNTPTGKDYQSIPAEYSETRTIPVIDKPTDYYLSVVRFSVPMNNVPIFIFQTENGSTQTDPNLGSYSVCLTDSGGNNSQQKLTFYPSQLYVNVPPPPSQNPPTYTQALSPYYYVFDISHMLDMINVALVQAEAALPPVAGRDPPFFVYDATTKLVSLKAQEAYYDTFSPGAVRIWANIPILRFVSEIPIVSVTELAVAFEKQFYFKVYNTGNNSDGTILTMTQETPSLSLWNDVTSVVFTTGRIPINQEAVPVEANTSDFMVKSQQGIPNCRPVLTDFEIIAQDDANLRTTLQYVPTGPYRLVDLMSDMPLRALDVQVWWQDRSNQLHKITIGAGQHLTMKLLFVKKEYFKRLHKLTQK